MGDATSAPIRLSFNPQLRVEFRGATVTSDAGLLLPRELDERLGLHTLIERHLADPRTGHNRQFPLPDLFRQSIYSHLDAPLVRDGRPRGGAELPRPCSPQHSSDPARRDAITDPACWSGPSRTCSAGLAADRATPRWSAIAASGIRRPPGSESPVHGAQEQSAYNGHFESVCYHPLFILQLAESPLTQRLFAQIIRRIERLAWRPT